MYFFQFNQNPTIYTDLIAIRHLKWQNQPLVSYQLAEDGPRALDIVAILPYFDRFLPILSKLKYLYRCNRHPTLQCQISHLLAEDQGRPIPVQWKYCQFSMYFFQFNQNSTIYTDFNRYPTPTMPKLTHYPTPTMPKLTVLLAENPAMPIPNVVAIFDGYLPIPSIPSKPKCNRHWTPKMPKLTLCLPNSKIYILSSVSHLLAEDPGPLIPSVEAILLDFEIFFKFRNNSSIYKDLAVIRPF